MLQFRRVQSSPVLTKGGSYGGWAADALAAPAACWDGSRFVMTVSLWSIANSKWASAFFTSTNLVNWSYVTSSLRSPQGSDYILGNSGLAWFASKYFFAYNHYPSVPNGIALQTSTDLLTWTTVADFLSFAAYGADPSLVVNPINGKLEIWYVNGSRLICMADSPDGTTWTDHGVVYSSAIWNSTDFGEPSAFYHSGARRLTFDAATDPGKRMTGMALDASASLSFTSYGTVNGSNLLNSWESVNVFDFSTLGAFDLSDGRGAVWWGLYAGSDIAAATDNTDSSIGLAFMAPPISVYAVSGPSAATVGVASPTFTVTASDGLFSGTQTITLTASNGTVSATASGGTISGNGTGMVIVTPALGKSAFTFTYTPATAGTRTITYTNGQGWTDASASSVTVTTINNDQRRVLIAA
jgi:hypothetical protein